MILLVFCKHCKFSLELEKEAEEALEKADM